MAFAFDDTDFPHDTPIPDNIELSDDAVVERYQKVFQVAPYLPEFTLDGMDLPIDTPLSDNAELSDDAIIEICQKVFQVTLKQEQLYIVRCIGRGEDCILIAKCG